MESKPVGDSNYDRAYLMALSAWKTFGHSTEPHTVFARRMALIGEADGLNAAAEAIANDCREKGLEMSAGRVLKSLAHALDRHRDQLHRLKSIEDFQIEETGRLPPAMAEIFGAEAARPQTSRIPWGCILFGLVALAGVGWLFFR
jgi:hypothetical protein